MALGLFGGSFDPPHLAHLALAHCALDQLALEALRWVPAGQPWQKAGVTAAEHRRAMVGLMIAGEARFVLDAGEIEREGASYTIDTVERLGDGEEVFLVIGQDQYARLPTWHRWQDLLARVTLAVAARAGEAVTAPGGMPAHRMRRLELPALQISSTQVRELASRGEDIRPLVGPAVAEYISRHRLYLRY